jgi:glutamyl-tRNA synthetase
LSVRVRFAPSPTGFLHVGGARTALFNYLHARRMGGTFVLRIEDTDVARSTDEATAAILSSLRWLGLSWDEGPETGGRFGPYFQSQRGERYHRHAAALSAAGRAYPCYCTAEELEARRAEQTRRGEPPRYDGRCRALTAAERAAREAEGRGAALRFRLPSGGETAWDDVVRSRVAFANDVLDDFVLLRSDGHPTYNFACVVDDHEMEITHVIRGDDHISNTPRQILLYAAFDFRTPVFAHVPMILGADGTRLSKRHGATSVEAFRDLGILPEALVNFLALLGWSFDGKRELFTLAELEQVFALERVGSNPAVFNLEKLEWMNSQHLKGMAEEERVRRVEEFLATQGRDLATRTPEWRRALVRAIGDRLRTLADAGALRRLRAGRYVSRGRCVVGRDAGARGGGRPARGAGEAARGAARVHARSARARDARARGRARDQGRRDHRHGARCAHRAQGEPRDLRGDVAFGARAHAREVGAGRGALAGGDAPRGRV